MKKIIPTIHLFSHVILSLTQGNPTYPEHFKRSEFSRVFILILLHAKTTRMFKQHRP